MRLSDDDRTLILTLGGIAAIITLVVSGHGEWALWLIVLIVVFTDV